MAQIRDPVSPAPSLPKRLHFIKRWYIVSPRKLTGVLCLVHATSVTGKLSNHAQSSPECSSPSGRPLPALAPSARWGYASRLSSAFCIPSGCTLLSWPSCLLRVPEHRSAPRDLPAVCVCTAFCVCLSARLFEDCSGTCHRHCVNILLSYLLIYF